MAITSYGFAGTIEEAAWARMAPRLGVPYWVKDTESLVATIDTTRDRAITLSPGEFGGVGIFNVSDAVEKLQFDYLATGSRYDLVVARRNWQGTSGTTTFQIIKGGSSLVLPTYNRNPGVVDDHPLYLVEIRAGQTKPAAIYDLRGFGANGKVIVKNKLAMDYYSDYPGLELQWEREIWTVRGSRTWMRTGLEPHTTFGQDEYFVRFNTGLKSWPYGGGLPELRHNWSRNKGENAMGAEALTGGRVRINMSGVYAINLNVYDYSENNPKRFFGSVRMGLSTPDLPRVEAHRHDKNSGFEAFIGTTQLLKQGTILKAYFSQYNTLNRSMKYQVELGLHMIG